jgi:hypothetical protein
MVTSIHDRYDFCQNIIFPQKNNLPNSYIRQVENHMSIKEEYGQDQN